MRNKIIENKRNTVEKRDEANRTKQLDRKTFLFLDETISHKTLFVQNFIYLRITIDFSL